jgi:hypothetical protein
LLESLLLGVSEEAKEELLETDLPVDLAPMAAEAEEPEQQDLDTQEETV